jgi:hypothetical protein
MEEDMKIIVAGLELAKTMITTVEKLLEMIEDPFEKERISKILLEKKELYRKAIKKYGLEEIKKEA